MDATFIPFGTPVIVSGRYARTMEGQRRYWRAVGFRADNGLVIGKRTLRNGTTHYETYHDEYGSGGYDYFETSEYVTAYLVAFPNCNPMYIPMDCIKIKEGE